MRKTFVVAVIVLTLGIASQPAQAPPNTDLLHPSSVKLIRGTTTASASEAVADLESDSDALRYDVDATLLNGIWAMSYEFGVAGVKPPKALTLQWNGQPTVSCLLHLSAYDFVAKRWVGQNFDAESAAPSLQSFEMSRPSRFVKKHHMRGRVSCSNESAFTLSSSRIRVPDVNK